MRGAVPQDAERGGVVTLEGDQGEGVALGQGVRQVDRLAIDGSRDRGLCQSRPDRLGGITRGGTIAEFEGGARRVV